MFSLVQSSHNCITTCCQLGLLSKNSPSPTLAVILYTIGLVCITSLSRAKEKAIAIYPSNLNASLGSLKTPLEYV